MYHTLVQWIDKYGPETHNKSGETAPLPEQFANRDTSAAESPTTGSNRPVHSQQIVEEVLDRSLKWAKDQEYAGWDPYDGLNSPVLSPFAQNWFARLVCIHGVNKSPLNLRRLLRIEKERNPMGIALFAMAYLNRYKLSSSEADLNEAESLLNWLEANQSQEFEYPCWGYNFGWQNARKFFLPANHPSIVVSVFVVESFMRHYEITGDEDSLQTAIGACDFILEEINTVTVNGREAYTYTPYDDFVVVNANALAARLLATVGAETDDERYQSRATELVEVVIDAQHNGAWHYSIPNNDSTLSIDNFHTGYVLESLQDCMTVQEVEGASQAYDRGMEFYRTHLFESSGAPKFEHDTRLPYDIHSCAQAIQTLAKDPDPASDALAEKVLTWTIANLFDSDGYFYRRIGRFWNDETPYIRWNQAWMCAALSTNLRFRHDPARREEL